MFRGTDLKLVCAVALSLAVAACGQSLSSQAAPLRHIRETKDRLSDEQIENMVTGPMAAVLDRGLAQGEAEFDILLRKTKSQRGENSVQVADLLTAFGVQLFTQGKLNDDNGLKNASLPYLKTAVDVYRAAFGRADPEVALALTSYADAALGIDEDAVPPGSEEALQEAAQIRLKALGPVNAETRATYLTLAELHGRPARIQGRQQRLGEVEREFERLIDAAPNDPALRETSAPMMRFVLANTYARNGQGEQALYEARRAISMMDSWPPEYRCKSTNSRLQKLQAIFESHHQTSFANRVEDQQPVWHRLSCALTT